MTKKTIEMQRQENKAIRERKGIPQTTPSGYKINFDKKKCDEWAEQDNCNEEEIMKMALDMGVINLI